MISTEIPPSDLGFLSRLSTTQPLTSGQMSLSTNQPLPPGLDSHSAIQPPPPPGVISLSPSQPPPPGVVSLKIAEPDKDEQISIQYSQLEGNKNSTHSDTIPKPVQPPETREMISTEIPPSDLGFLSQLSATQPLTSGQMTLSTNQPLPPGLDSHSAIQPPPGLVSLKITKNGKDEQISIQSEAITADPDVILTEVITPDSKIGPEIDLTYEDPPKDSISRKAVPELSSDGNSSPPRFSSPHRFKVPQFLPPAKAKKTAPSQAAQRRGNTSSQAAEKRGNSSSPSVPQKDSAGVQGVLETGFYSRETKVS